MERYAKVQSSLWTNSRKFKQLNMQERYVYLYLLTCQHGNSAGLYRMIPNYSAFDCGMNLEVYDRAIDSLMKALLIAFDRIDNVVYIKQYMKFNQITNEKHAKGTAKVASEFRESSVYKDWSEEAAFYFKGFDSYIDSPIDSPMHSQSIQQNTDNRIQITDNRIQITDKIPLSTAKQIDYHSILNEYHSICISLPKLRSMTNKRKTAIRSFLKSHSLDELTELFEKTEVSDFLTNRSGNWSGCGFDWILKAANAQKILEGNYDNKGNNGMTKEMSELQEWYMSATEGGAQ